MEDKYIPVLFYKSKYAERLPIGTLESLQTFTHSSLKRFYRDWYRPDLMAVVAVGDINTKEMEAKIKKYFSTIPKVENPRQRVIYDLPSHKETLFSIVSDNR